MTPNLTPNPELRTKALEALSGKWNAAILVTLATIGIAMASMIFIIPYFFVVPVLAFGLHIVFLNLMRSGTEPKVNSLFEGFKNNYGKNCGTIWLMAIYTMLWSLLFYIPGIIKIYSYAMTPYILKDEPELGANETIEKSMAMMKGNKIKLFLLNLSFIGWIILIVALYMFLFIVVNPILGIVVYIIGLVVLCPYMHCANAAFYEDLKNNQQQEGQA